MSNRLSGGGLNNARVSGMFTVRRKSVMLSLITIHILWLFPHILMSQTDTLSLSAAIDLALKNNLTLSIAQFGYAQAQQRSGELKATRFPSLLFRTHYLHAPVPGYSEIVTNGGEYGLQFTTSYPLYDGGLREAQIEQSLAQQDRSLIDLHKARIEMAYSVRTLYFEAVRIRGEYSIHLETIDRLQSYLTLLNQLRLGGNATESDLLKAGVELDNAKIDLAQTEQELAAGKSQLVNALGLPLRTEVEVIPADISDSTNVTDFAIANSPDLQALQKEKVSAMDDLQATKSERLPTLSVSGDAGVLGVKTSQFHRDIGYSILLSLDVPIFTWGGTSSRIEQKELEVKKTDAQLQLQQRQLETDWKNTLNDLEVTRKNIADYTHAIEIAHQNYLSAKSRFAGGAETSLDVLDAHRSLVDAELNRNNAIFHLRSLLAMAIRLSGKE